MVNSFRNISFAAAESFRTVMDEGTTVTVRDHETRELRSRVTTLRVPQERCLFLSGRNNSIFAQVAETLWVIGGRNDVPWLARYLEKAPDYSDDDGNTWRGAYGPRLRAWPGDVDQLAEWRRLLLDDRKTRRAVGVLFDPARDFTDSLDIPCNNWVSWLIRDDHLHMNVAIRSNDAMWGFSGVNAFMWSVLHEMLACWVGTGVGEATFLASSYHLYDWHYERAQLVADRFSGLTPYDCGVHPSPFSTPWREFPAALAHWFDAEEQLRLDPDATLLDGPALDDPFLASTLRVLRMKWGAKVWSNEQLGRELGNLPEDDFAAAAYELFGRSNKDLLKTIPQPGIRDFFRLFNDTSSSLNQNRFSAAIKALHARKNLSYGASWKRRGERVSVLPNIARKVDRLKTFALTGLRLDGETVLDTAIDLFVYSLKYRLLLAEQPGAKADLLRSDAPSPFSDHDSNFDYLLDQTDFTRGDAENPTKQIGLIVERFELMWPLAEGNSPVAERQQVADAFADEAARLVAIVAAHEPRAVAQFVHLELETR